ncbi:MAG TPA: DUF3857 domain-containing protein [Thermoanaerobaculia bacterium]|nr:DUF3857 domain-containing protein [Thermoanaerobaculia bacterium]
MRRAFVLPLLLIALPVRVYAGFSQTQDFRPMTAEERAMTTAPVAPGAPAAVLDWIRIDDDQIAISSEYTRIKVFTDAGKKYADVEVPFVVGYPMKGRVTEISARTLKPDGTVVPFDGKVYDKLLYKNSRATVRAKVFSLADVQPGSILEYRFVRRWSKSVLPGTTWTIQRDIPLLHVKFTIKPYKRPTGHNEFGSFFTYSGLPPGKVPVKDRDSYELELENIPAFQSEEYAPPEEELKPRVSFYYTTSRVPVAQFWSVEAETWSKKIENFIGHDGFAAAAGRELANGSSDPADTLRKIYARVQSLRNYSFESEKSEQELDEENVSESKSADWVLRNGAGFRDELNRLFVAMARGAGLDAAAVRVAPRDKFFFSQEVPDAEQMAGEVAVVTLGSETRYFDPGTPHAPFGVVSWEKSNAPGFQVSPRAPAKWLKVPSAPPSASVTRRVAALRLDGENLVGTITVTLDGQEALVRRLRAYGEDETARNKPIEDEVKAWFPAGAAVKTKSVTGLTSFAEPVVAVFDVTLPNLIARAGSRVTIPLSVFAYAAKTPFAPATRTFPIYFKYPRSEEDEVKLAVPESLAIAALPTPSKLKAGAFGYTSSTEQDGNVVTFRRSMSIDAMLVEAKYYAAVRNFYSAMIAADQKPLLLAPR